MADWAGTGIRLLSRGVRKRNAPKLALFLGDLGRRTPYLLSILLVLSCGGPEVPADIPQAMEWRFDEPQPGWTVTIPPPYPLSFRPALVSQTDETLQVTLGPANVSRNNRLYGGAYVEVPDLDHRDWAQAVIRARASGPVELALAFNLEVPPRVGNVPYEILVDDTPLVGDSTVQTYRLSMEPSTNLTAWAWGRPVRQLGFWLRTEEPVTVDILSVSLVSKDADYRVSESIVQKCRGLTNLTPEDLPNPTTVITFANLDAAEPERDGDWAALPEHCRIQGKINERVGVNDQRFAINFRMRLPTDWNGRFFFQGGSGTNGSISHALGRLFDHPTGIDNGQEPPFPTALTLGYAVVSQDAGHDNQVDNDSTLDGTATFGFDPQARIDYGYNSYDQVTQAAKALIKAYYGKPPEKSFYFGCSEGGREGMMMSQRFPTYFDGIVAMAPGINFPKAVVAEAWEAQAVAKVARAAGSYDEFGQPFLNKTFTDDDLVLVSNAVLEVCDTLDGLADGIVDNFPACTTAVVGPRLADLTCSGSKEPTCLSAQQVTALKKVYGGPKNSQGEELYSDFPWDAGIGGKVGDAYFTKGRELIGQFNSARNYGNHIYYGPKNAAVWTTPPTPVASFGADPLVYLLDFNLDTDAPKIFATTETYTESASDFMMASSTDLSAFESRKGKLIIVTGMTDLLFSINDMINWWDEVNRVNDGTAGDFVRLFAVPGINHCQDGPATDRFDALTAIVNWVESGIAPDRIIAEAKETTAWPNRTRPLCPWPKQARYKGSGSIEEADSFACVDVVRN